MQALKTQNFDARAVAFWLRDLELERYNVFFARAGLFTFDAITKLSDAESEFFFLFSLFCSARAANFIRSRALGGWCRSAKAQNWPFGNARVSVLLFGDCVVASGAGHGSLLAIVCSARNFD